MKSSKKTSRKGGKKIKPDNLYNSIVELSIFIMALVSAEYHGRLGPIPFGTKVDWKKVEGKFNPRLFFVLSVLVSKGCYLFNLSHHEEKNNPNKKSFRDWFEEMGVKLHHKRPYDERFFGKTLKIPECTVNKIFPMIWADFLKLYR